jgi:4,5-DOPA dioxygenase extradiol
MEQTKRMPVLFVGHGSPLNAMVDTSFSEEWKRLGTLLPKPKAILAISAHFYARGTYLNDAAEPEQIYDMYGFPEELYQIVYRPQGNPVLADRVAKLLGGKKDHSFGIDHGVWSVLRRMYPKADIPVVEMSVNGNLSFVEMVRLGEKLKPLRDEGVLILGSGAIVHNLSLVDWDSEKVYPWAEGFQKRVNLAVERKDLAFLTDIRKDPDAAKAFQTVEHYAPLLYVMGAVDQKDSLTILNDQETLGAISMTSYLFQLQN